MPLRRSTGRNALAAALLVVGSTSVAMAGSRSGAAAASAVAETCVVVGDATQSGSPVISGPMVSAVTGSALPLTLDVSAEVTPEIAPGGLVTTLAELRIDLAATAADVLAQRVHPAIAAAGYPQLVTGSWVELDLPRARASFAGPPGSVGADGPTATSTTTGTEARWDGSTAVVELGPLHADSRLAAAPTGVRAGWRRTDGGGAAPRTLATDRPTLGFTATVTVGVELYGSPLTGSVTATWTCHPGDGASLADTQVSTGPVTTTTPSPLPDPGDPVEPPPTSAPPTTWKDRPSLGPDECPSPTLDSYGGDATVTLAATGRFRTQRIDGRWWLVDPDGHPFWSAGVNHVTFEGTPDRHGVAGYRDSVLARYGTPERWADAQLGRLRSWGYNTLGAWSDTDTFASRTPYTLLLGVTDSDFASGRMQDLWEPSWMAGVESTVAAAALAHGDDPMLVGYWFDNELHWSPDWRPLHLFDEYLGMAASAPGKQALVAWLQGRYPSFPAFAADVSTDATSWADLAEPTRASTWTRSGGEATRAAWTGAVAERYFGVTAEVLHRLDPGHLDLGARLIAQTTGRPVLEAAARHVDVVSLNDYVIDAALVPGLAGADPTYLSVEGPLTAQAEVTGKPLLVSEWGFRAADSGLPNTWPPLFPTLQTQSQRAAASESFELGLQANPSVVGQHIFEFADEPAAGRFDGEDSNFGLVDVNDDPYVELEQVGRTMLACAYARLHPLVPTSSTTTRPLSGPTTVTAIGLQPAPAAEPITGPANFTG